MEWQEVMERGEKAGVSSSSNGGDEVCAVKEMMDVIDTVGSYVGYRRTQRKECLNLVRRLKLLVNLKKSLLGAKKLLKKCGCGSKIYLAMESEAVMSSFHAVYDNLNQALDDLPYDELGISDEVNEQVELTRMQLKRAKRRADTQDIELAMDMMVVFSKKQIAGVDETIVLDGPVSSKSLQRCQSLIIPHEFLCPITMEIMVDPVIVASGQTYERESIQKWLNSKHRTCPKTGQILDHLSLATNFALRNLILQWCEKNNYELPKKDACLRSDGFSAEFIEEISSLVQNLSSREFELLSCQDSRIQEHTVTALLNLSIDETNKRLVAREGAIPAIIEILQNGTDEARENSAAALFSLSILDENKVLIGGLNGIRPLVYLLQNGTVRGKKDAATALFNLSLNQTNKSRAIKAGIIPALLCLLEENNLGMVDEALSILLLLASHPEGRNEIGRLSFIKTLVRIIRNGTPEKQGMCHIRSSRAGVEQFIDHLSSTSVRRV
ncbi:hypothetical protein OIU76_030384 [Salix suchowensis]|nr:hypothetical protein OIU76_030384 [Salix suchowensis]